MNSNINSVDEKFEKSGSKDKKRERRQKFKEWKEKKITEYEKSKQKFEMYYREKSKPVITQKEETMDKKVSEVPLEPSVEFFHLKVNITQDVPKESTTSGEIQRDIVNPDEILVQRRKDEGMKPIFDRPEVRLFHQLQREKENEIFMQKHVFVHELKKLIKLLFPEEHRRMSVDEIRSNSTDHRDRYYSPQTCFTSKSSAFSEKLEANNAHKSLVESETTTNGETVKNCEIQDDVRSEDDFLMKREVEETKPPLDDEEIKLLDEWQKEIDARRQSCLKQMERDRSRWRSRSTSRSVSPYYRSQSLTRDEILYREYEMPREQHGRRKASELMYYMDRIPIPTYYDAMPLRMMPMRLPAGRLPFPGRSMYPGMRSQFFPPGT